MRPVEAIMTTATVVRPQVESHRHEATSISEARKPEPFTLVLFGATGDLAGRKLFPALVSLLKDRYLPEKFAIIGIGRRDKSDQAFRDDVKKELVEFANGTSDETCDGFLAHV